MASDIDSYGATINGMSIRHFQNVFQYINMGKTAELVTALVCVSVNN